MTKIILQTLIIVLMAIPAIAKLRIGFTEVVPYGYKDKEGNIHGINYEILQQIEKKSGLEFEYRLYPQARLTAGISAGDMDIALVFDHTCALKYAEGYEFQSPLYNAKSSIFTAQPLSPAMKEIKIARIRGTCSLWPKESDQVKSVFYDVNNFAQAIEMVRAKRLDGVCGLEPVIRYHIKRMKAPDFYIWKAHPKEMRAGLCLRKDLPADVKKKLKDASDNLEVNLDINKYLKNGPIESAQ